MRMKALQDRSITQEGVISRLRKHNEILTNKQDQYKDALYTLNKEVTELTEKLKKETHQREKEQEAKVTLEKELKALYGQVETARADTIIEFKASKPFIDTCAVYYGDKFEECLKQVNSVYPHLDLSKVTMDDLLSSTPTGDTIFEETDTSTQSERDPKNDGVVLAQPAVDTPITPLILSAEAPQVAEKPPTQNLQDPSSKDDENLTAQDAQDPLVQLFIFNDNL